MSDNKKYYYLRLKENFYDTDAMIVLESMPDGYLYSNILMKLYLRSLKNDGKLMFNDKIPYNSTMLAQITRHQVGTIEKAVRIFEDLGLIEVLDNGAIYISDIQDYIGKTSTEADRKRNYRNKIDSEKLMLNGQMSGQMSQQMSDKSPPEIEIEIDQEINKNIVHSDEMDVFEKLWNLYPRKEGKARITKSKAKLKEISKIGFEHMERAINRYKKTVEGRDKQYIIMGSTFFTTDYKDFLDNTYNENDYKREKATKNTTGAPDNMTNFKGRNYSDDEYEKFYSNL